MAYYNEVKIHIEYKHGVFAIINTPYIVVLYKDVKKINKKFEIINKLFDYQLKFLYTKSKYMGEIGAKQTKVYLRCRVV